MSALGRAWCAIRRRPYLEAACDRHALLLSPMSRAIYWGGLVRAAADRLRAGEAPAPLCCRIGVELACDASELLAESWRSATAFALMDEASRRG